MAQTWTASRTRQVAVSGQAFPGRSENAQPEGDELTKDGASAFFCRSATGRNQIVDPSYGRRFAVDIYSYVISDICSPPALMRYQYFLAQWKCAHSSILPLL
jgi:hypothetical protein